MKNLLIGGGIILVIVVVWSLSREDNASNVVATSDNQADQVADSQLAPSEVTLIETDNEATVTEATDMESTDINGSYQTYSEEVLAASTATHNVLIFSATWCPSCRALDKDINENISDLPGDVALFTIDYDTNVVLRQQYGVTSQHTLVLVETDGTEIKKWVGGNTLTALLANL